MDLEEQACWLLLAFESGLPARIVNTIVIDWCRELKRPLREFFAAGPQEWRETCKLSEQIIQKLASAQEKLAGQVFLAEQLTHEHISLLTVLDEQYPAQLKATLRRSQTPPLLCYIGDLEILKRQTIAIIGSRNAGEKSLAFTRAASHFLASKGVNVISGNARGVDRVAYEGAISADAGYTTVVLPHGIRKLSKVQMNVLLPRIEAGRVLLISQFHPDAPWLVSRAMERNRVVTGLAQVVIVAESDVRGGTWDGANAALQQRRPLYVHLPNDMQPPPGNKALIERGAQALRWSADMKLNDPFLPLLEKSVTLQHMQNTALPLPVQLPFASPPSSGKQP